MSRIVESLKNLVDKVRKQGELERPKGLKKLERFKKAMQIESRKIKGK